MHQLEGSASSAGSECGELAIVVIGRNEGARLERCLRTLADCLTITTYVDSGSTDRSVEFARSLGVDVVRLDPSRPFSAGRARNAGFDRRLGVQPKAAWVQFLDGDCGIVAGWLERAQTELELADDVAIVSGRCREHRSEVSLYKRLVDIELETPLGDSNGCGGNFMVRVGAFRRVGGFNPRFIAGEEPELCLRLRRHGWRILRVGVEMALHDAAMTTFSQWWRRTSRAGYAHAQTAWTHPVRSGWWGTRAVLSMTLWALAVPGAAIGLALPSGGLSLLLLCAYPVQWARIALATRRKGRSPLEAAFYAAFVVLGKFAHARGALRFLISRLLGRPSEIIEYKGQPDAAAPGKE